MTGPDKMDARADAIRLNRLAMQALAARRIGDARALLLQALDRDATLVQAWMNLAAIRRMERDFVGALEAVDAARKIDPLYFPALLMRGSLYEAIGKPRHAALAYNIALTQMLPEDCRDEAIRRAVLHAQEFYAGYRREMEIHLRAELGVDGLTGETDPAVRMRGFVDHLLGKRQIPEPEAGTFGSKPNNFYYPGLHSAEFFDRGLFPWLADLEAAGPAIEAELAGVFDDQVATADIEPYLQYPDTEAMQDWAGLNRSTRWSAYHFANHGMGVDSHRRKCPVTAAFLDSAPQPRIQFRSPAALFSILQPHTHIPPHNGVANFRLLCHLPLILPPRCRLRVGNKVREWRMGEAFVFDDTVEHEAWNDSDDMRTVLIFDIWHPQLTADERSFISRTVAVLDRFNEMT